MRENFKYQFENEFNFGVIYNILHPQEQKNEDAPKEPPKMDDALSLELSKLGAFVCDGPIEDAGISISIHSNSPQIISLLAYSVTGKGKDKLIGKLRYCPSKFSDFDATVLSESIKHALESLQDEMTVGNAINDLKIFQEGLFKQRPQNYTLSNEL